MRYAFEANLKGLHLCLLNFMRFPFNLPFSKVKFSLQATNDGHCYLMLHLLIDCGPFPFENNAARVQYFLGLFPIL